MQYREARELVQPEGGQFTYRTTFDIVRTLKRAGVGILAGTDGPFGCLLPGAALHDELEAFVRAGLTQLDALRSATIEPARVMGLADSLGTIARGKVADLVLLDASPLEDIRNARRVAGVVADGRWISNREIGKMERKASDLANGKRFRSPLPDAYAYSQQTYRPHHPSPSTK